MTEHALVARLRAGDQRAFEELVDRYQHLVFAIVARSVPDRADAEDLSQEVFVRVHRGLPYFRGDARLSTWIYRIALNVCTEARQRAREHRPLDATMVAEPASRDRAFSDFELRDRLEKALAQLPPRYRVLVAAHYLDGVRYDDLAEAFELPMGTVKTYLHRARRELRRLLQEGL